ALVAQPAVFINMVSGSVVEAVEDVSPADGRDELSADVTVFAGVAEVALYHAPAIVVDGLDVLVRHVEKRNVGLVPVQRGGVPGGIVQRGSAQQANVVQNLRARADFGIERRQGLRRGRGEGDQ